MQELSVNFLFFTFFIMTEFPIKSVLFGIVGVILLYLFFSSWYTVSPTEKAVTIRLGTLSDYVR